MFREFLTYFNKNDKLNYSGNFYNDFILQLGGKSFGKGLFNSFSKNNLKKWTEIVNEAYPEFKGMFMLFGYDWLGRCFGIDLRENTQGEVLMFEIGTNDVLEIPCSFLDFLNEEMPSYSDACLSESFFYEWMDYSNEQLEYGTCAGYIVPLFLGGEDVVTNLEKSDMEVYWGVISQIKKHRDDLGQNND